MRKWISLCLALALLAAAAVPVFAVETPDVDKPGSITFQLEWEGTPLDSGSLRIQRVGDVSESNGNYGFTLMEALQDSGLALDDIQSPALARSLAELAAERNLEMITAPIENGKAVFENLLPGLYVVTQDEETAPEGFAPLAPFLISLPQWTGEQYLYDIAAKPKVGLEVEPTEPTEPPPTEPGDPDLPYTGQLEWPVPVMAIGGMVLFALGWFLCFRKRDSHA